MAVSGVVPRATGAAGHMARRREQRLASRFCARICRRAMVALPSTPTALVFAMCPVDSLCGE